MARKNKRYAAYRKRQKKRIIILAVFCLAVIAALPFIIDVFQADRPSILETGQSSAADFVIPQYTGADYVEINGNIPFFLE
jgi:hypothetical protein